MIGSLLWWIVLNLFFLMMLAFYSMIEMACVSFNKVRLQYYVSQGNRRAIWIYQLMQNSSVFFGTTLIGVNVALMAGSESARQLYLSLGFNPDLAPLTQVLIVVIFGELAPMFAARRYAEHVALLGIPVLYATAKVMTPVLWMLKYVIKFFSWVIGGKKEVERTLFLTQEELISMLEQQDDERQGGENSDFNKVVSQIFSLRNKDAGQLMEPLNTLPLFSSNSTIENVRLVLEKEAHPYILIYHRERNNIVAIAAPRDLIRAPDTHRVRDYAHPPWFVTQKTHVLQILKQFRKNNKSIAVILNSAGQSIGLLTLDNMIETILGSVEAQGIAEEEMQPQKIIVVDKTIPGDMTIKEFKEEFKTEISGDDDQTVSELIIEQLGHIPSVDELIFIKPFEWIVKEVTLMGVKSISVRTRMR